jgi:hypothetical protein
MENQILKMEEPAQIMKDLSVGLKKPLQEQITPRLQNLTIHLHNSLHKTFTCTGLKFGSKIQSLQ